MVEYTYRDVRLATIDELKRIIWQAIENRDSRLLRMANDRYNEIMKYDY